MTIWPTLILILAAPNTSQAITVNLKEKPSVTARSLEISCGPSNKYSIIWRGFISPKVEFRSGNRRARRSDELKINARLSGLRISDVLPMECLSGERDQGAELLISKAAGLSSDGRGRMFVKIIDRSDGVFVSFEESLRTIE